MNLKKILLLCYCLNFFSTDVYASDYNWHSGEDDQCKKNRRSSTSEDEFLNQSFGSFKEPSHLNLLGRKGKERERDTAADISLSLNESTRQGEVKKEKESEDAISIKEIRDQLRYVLQLRRPVSRNSVLDFNFDRESESFIEEVDSQIFKEIKSILRQLVNPMQDAESLHHDSEIQLAHPVGLVSKIKGQPESKVGKLIYVADGNCETLSRYKFLDEFILGKKNGKAEVITTAMGCLSSLLGIPCSIASCGYLLYGLGDSFDIPVNSPVSIGIQIATFVTAAPAFMTQFFHIGKNTSYSILYFLEKMFCSSLDENADLKPRTFGLCQDIPIHSFLKACNIVPSAINASTLVILLYFAEEDIPAFFWTAAIPVFMSWFDNNHSLGLKTLRNIFYPHRPYNTRDTCEYRQKLKSRIINYKRSLQNGSEKENTVRINDSYEEIEAKRDNFIISDLEGVTGSDIDRGLRFYKILLSAFLRDGNPQNISSTNSQVSKWSRFCSYFSGAITAGSYIGKCYLGQVLIQKCLQGEFNIGFSMDEEPAWIISMLLAGFETTTNLIVSYQGQKTYIDGIKDFFYSFKSPKDNFWSFRKLGEVTSFLLSGGYALAPVVAGKEFLAETPTFLENLVLSSLFISNLPYFHQFFLSNWNSFWDNISETIAFLGRCTTAKRARLQSTADMFYDSIDELDQGTITLLNDIAAYKKSHK